MMRTFNLPYLNYNHIENNINSVYEFTNNELNLTNSSENIKEKYFESINQIQSIKVPYKTKKINICFFDEILQNGLLSLEMIDSKDLENKNHIYLKDKQIIIRNNIDKALELINVLHPSLSKLINNLVGTFLILKKDGFGGGSVSNIMGLIWLNPQEEWNVIDYAEAIYHEFIHQSIFLDDMVNSMFPDPDACATDEGLVTSTILKRKRPLDRSYHAACVSIGVMHLHYMLGDSNKAKQHIKDLKITIREINGKKKFLGEQGLLTLIEINKFLDNPDFETISSILND